MREALPLAAGGGLEERFLLLPFLEEEGAFFFSSFFSFSFSSFSSSFLGCSTGAAAVVFEGNSRGERGSEKSIVGN